MNTAIVTITSDPLVSFIEMPGEGSVQIARCLVRIADDEAVENIAMLASGEFIGMATAKGLLRKLKASNPTDPMTLVVSDSDGYSAVLLEDEAKRNSFPIAASIAVVKASWGWYESDPIIIRIKDAELRIHARHDGENWIASEVV